MIEWTRYKDKKPTKKDGYLSHIYDSSGNLKHQFVECFVLVNSGYGLFPFVAKYTFYYRGKEYKEGIFFGWDEQEPEEVAFWVAITKPK